MLDFDDSTKFSPYLALGCLSPRTFYFAIKHYEQHVHKNDSTYWVYFELLWRDYFYFIHKKYNNKLFKPGGLFNLPIKWSYNQDYIDAWTNAKTGYPLVDANMIELNETGFMSNRGRQNVASFLTKNLGIDWRIGAAWFESKLIDYDVSSNYGNWLYIAGVGNDARQFRAFNVSKQGKDYDPNGKYAKKWLPVLKPVEGKSIYDIHTFTALDFGFYGLDLERDYAKPVVDLNESLNKQRTRYIKAFDNKFKKLRM